MKLEERQIYINKRVRCIQNNKKVFLYNSFTGDWIRCNSDVLKILDHFKDFNTIGELESRDEYRDIYNVILLLIEKNILTYENNENYSNDKNQNPVFVERIKQGVHIRNLRLNVTEQCNMNCEYCFEKSSNNYIQRRIMSTNIMKTTIHNFFEILKHNKNDSCSIQFFGGEPLLNWKLVEEAIEFAYSEAKDEISLDLMINTNAVLLNEQLCKMFAKNNVTVIVSLDGVGEYNDKSRKFHNGVGSFEIVDKKLEILARNKCKTNIAIVCTDNNYHHLIEFVDYIDQKRNELDHNFRVAFSNVHICDREGVISLPYEKRVEYMMEAIHYSRQKGIDCFGGLSHKSLNNLVRPNGGRHCLCLGSELSVSPDGIINPCYGIQTKMGDIWNMKDIFRSREYLNLVERVKGNITECKNCDIEAFCAGGCYGEYLSDAGKESCTYRDCELEKMMFVALVKEYFL